MLPALTSECLTPPPAITLSLSSSAAHAFTHPRVSPISSTYYRITIALNHTHHKKEEEEEMSARVRPRSPQSSGGGYVTSKYKVPSRFRDHSAPPLAIGKDKGGVKRAMPVSRCGPAYDNSSGHIAGPALHSHCFDPSMDCCGRRKSEKTRKRRSSRAAGRRTRRSQAWHARWLICMERYGMRKCMVGWKSGRYSRNE
jgi:hypothetical protein